MKVPERIRHQIAANKYVVSTLLFVLTIAASFYHIEQQKTLQKIERDSTAYGLLAAEGVQLERALMHSLASTYVLAKEIKDNNGVIVDFEKSASTVLQMIPGAKNLQLAPNGVLEYVYPMAGSEKAIGHDLLRDQNRSAEALMAIHSRSLTLAGPFTLIQGGVGMVGRNPIFIDHEGGSRFWGFANALILLDDLLDQTEFCTLLCDKYNYELGKVRVDDDSRVEVFASGGDALTPDAYSYTVVVPNGRWVLRIEPKLIENTVTGLVTYIVCVCVCVCLAALFAFYSFLVLREPERLRKLVELQTHDLHDLAYKDSLTGLPNRRLFCESIKNYISEEESNDTAMELLLIDLDRFKEVNDTRGSRSR
ncbi:hypothetical protein AB833_08320 [Chromatiales bacterium (ex Bugula neritina AB1)]|nr:hypothetical protein AB833_08320 [Chromatiales bacterium (ex Bugula neritina AB1)]